MKIKNYLSAFKSMLFVKFGIKTPIMVYHFVTNRCNLNCCFCSTKALKREDEMTTEEIKNCMVEFKKAGTQIWAFAGGESLLRNDFSELVDYAKEIGLMVSIVTNGILIEKHLKAILKLDSIMISLDGPKEIHNKIRNVECYDIVVKNLDLLVKHNKTPIINMVVYKDNLKDIDYMIDFAKKHKCNIDFSFIVPNLEENKQYALTSEQANNAVNKLLKLKEQNSFIITSTIYLKRILKYQNKQVNRFIPNCFSGKTFCVLSPEGEVALCVDMFKKGLNGKEIGFNKAFQNLKNPGCDCTFRCYFNTSHLHSLNILTSIRVAYNILKGKKMHDVHS